MCLSADNGNQCPTVRADLYIRPYEHCDSLLAAAPRTPPRMNSLPGIANTLKRVRERPQPA